MANILGRNGTSQTKFLELVTAITALTGVFLALLWFFGQNFVAGYFDSLGIESYQVSFSVWEYAGTAWYFPVLVAFLLIMFLELASNAAKLLLLLLKLGGEALGFLLARIKVNLPRKRRTQTRRKTKQGQARKRSVSPSWYFFMAIFSVLVIVLIASYSAQWGRYTGQSYLQDGARHITFVSRDQLGLPLEPEIIGKETYIYAGFRLLTYNNGKYFLFYEINPSDCRPREVYIVPETILVEVSTSGAEPFSLD